MEDIETSLGDGRFLVSAVLGEGATGRVYRAFDAQLGREVALKTLQRLDAEERYHLKREFRAVAGFSHPHVVQLYELFADGDACFFTMQLVDGESLRTWARGGAPAGALPQPDLLARGLRALGEVGEGLRALHAAGQLHRDVKPDNVRVTPDGRAVLLDFGLATAARRSLEHARPALLGTAAYAAPEQLLGRATPASDWYALGATLFELLTGHPPFTGPLYEILSRKQAGPPRPGSIAPGVSAALDALVADLLAPNPARRLDGAAALARLQAHGAAQGPRSAPAPPPFVGRTDARARLAAALADSRTRARVVWLHGPSGIGKTELALRFLGDARRDGARVLVGRCRLQETVAFRSLDALVDDLSREWLELAPDEARALVPEHAGELLRVFPVLARLPALADAPAPAPASDDEQLRRATAALRAVLARLAEQRPLVLWIDDAQWGDRGSVALLRSLLRPPDAPRVLLLVSHRSDDGGSGEAPALLREALDAEALPGEDVELPPLSPAEADELLQGCAAAPVDPAPRAALVAGAGGSPFLLLELARHLLVSDAIEPAPPVSQLLARRLAPLSPSARRLLELAAVAGRPFPAAFLLGVGGVGPAGQPLLLDLCAQSLLREGAGAADEVEPYHDRIREAVLEALTPVVRRQRHREIADGLVASDADEPGLLAEHWMGAGEDARAADQAVLAGERSAAALAFDRAADYFALALRLRGSEGSDWALQQRRAEALAHAGRSGDAGEACDLAVAALRVTDADEAHERALLGRAAEQYLYAGRWEEGLARTGEALARLGIAMPSSAAAAARRANLYRLRLLLRRDVGAGSLRAGPVRAAARERLAVLFGCAKGTALLFPKLSDYLGMRYLHEALAAGDPEHVGIGLAKEASLEGALPGPRWRRRAERMLDTARTVSARSGLPHVEGTVLTCESALAYFAADWRRCVEAAERALDVFRNRCVGESESLSITITFLLPGLVQCGALQRVRELVPGFLDDARRRGDLTLSRVIQAGDASLAALADGDPDVVMANADRLRELPSSPEEASLPYHYALATWRASLYRGDVADAWRRLEDAWVPLRASGMLSFEVFAVRLGALRAATALAAAARGGVPAWPRERLVRLARGEARRIARSRLPFAPPWAAVLRAGLAPHGRSDAAARAAALAQARAGFHAAAMPLHAHASALLDPAATADERAQALAFCAREGVREPERFAGVVLPGVAPATG